MPCIKGIKDCSQKKLVIASVSALWSGYILAEACLAPVKILQGTLRSVGPDDEVEMATSGGAVMAWAARHTLGSLGSGMQGEYELCRLMKGND